ncbi:Uncharacterized protein DBV15_06094 [Temnothorax longispinosus]|uniref:Uncharacterized protein n=1 Tax=Temnothorax longispinosus TaxID=300112 RepID=A0A4S2KH22_9HYME|nr:Uncharacterized protein DBV15_06094 [Temnothorax longispinosus]
MRGELIAVADIRMDPTVAFEDATVSSLAEEARSSMRRRTSERYDEFVGRRRYLIALSCKEAKIFVLKVFTGKTRLVFFARAAAQAGTQRINHDEDDRAGRILEKKSQASDLSDVVENL